MAQVISGYRPAPTITTVASGANNRREASVIKRADGVVVLAYLETPQTAGNFTLDAILHLRFSSDGCQTWTAEDTYTDGSAVTGFPMAPGGLTGNQGAGEPFLMLCPNGDLLIETWKSDYGTVNQGTYQSRSTDGGKTWSTPAQVLFASLPSAATWGLSSTLIALPANLSDWCFMTDDYFVDEADSNSPHYMYTVARVCKYGQSSDFDTTYGFQKSFMVRSNDNGATWTYLSDISSFTSVSNGRGTIETALSYLGNSTIIALLRPQHHGNSGTDDETRTYRSVSTGMGATWNGGTQTTPGALTEITYMSGHTGRHRIHSVAALKGQANWWTDLTRIMVGYTPIDNKRQPAVWLTKDGGYTWSLPMILDVYNGGQCYGDMVWSAQLNKYVVLTGMNANANGSGKETIRQYAFTLNGA